jgi:hypothetical protein
MFETDFINGRNSNYREIKTNPRVIACFFKCRHIRTGYMANKILTIP